MAKVKYRIREFKPTANQTDGHSVYVEAVVDNIITNKELAKKVESRTGMRAYEVDCIVPKEFSDMFHEEPTKI